MALEGHAMKKYRVVLTSEERQRLEDIRRKERGAAYRRTHAEILLLADQSSEGPAWTDEEIRKAVGVHKRTVENVRQRLVEQGLDAALDRKRREAPPVEPKLTGDQEARIIALACSPAPEGHARWTLSLLADTLVELGVFESLSHTSVATTLKKTSFNPTGRGCGASRRSRAPSSSPAWRT
jgi:transposase